MLVHWIWFATRAGVGDFTRKKLLARFGSPEAIFEAGEAELHQVEGLKELGQWSLMDKTLDSSHGILRRCTDKGIRILTYQDAAYPNRLKNIPDPPMVLYYKGNLPDFDALAVIGVVGTRSASPYGLTMAKRMGYQIAACGGVVASGLAAGVDAMAMKGALTAGGIAVGVLGCGVDVVYPWSNRALFEDTQAYGCILSEFPPETKPVGKHFPQRNRIISGLSCGVLVVEAPEKSGALITARLAADQGRDVFTIPSNVDNPAGRGSNQLLKDGAIPVETGWDILGEYDRQFPDRIRNVSGGTRLQAAPEEIHQAGREREKRMARVAQKPKKPVPSQAKEAKETKKVIDNGENEPYIDLNEIESSLSGDEKAIVAQLREGRRLVDEVIAATGLSAGAVLASLTLLEVKGVVHRLPGQFVELASRR